MVLLTFVGKIDKFCALFDIMNSSFYKYFPISDQDKNWGLHILDCGSVHIHPGMNMSNVPHPNQYQLSWEKGRVLNEYQLIYLAEGCGIFESKRSGQITIKSGSIILLFPGVWHRYKPKDDETWNTYWIGFNGNIAASMIPKLGITEENPISIIGNHDQIVNAFIEMIDIGQMEFSGYQQVLAGELFKLFGWIYALTKKSGFKESNIDSVIHRAKLQLMQLEHHIEIEEIAKELSLGYSKFRKLFKDYTGMSPGQFRMQYKLKKAMQMLNEGDLSIKEIALILGFESAQYFTRIFKLKTGTTPGKYK